MSTIIRVRLTRQSRCGYAGGVMKLWFKYALGMLFGSALYFVIPKTLLEDGGTIAFLAEISVRIGYYLLVPLLFTNLSLSAVKLYEEKKFWGVLLKSILFFSLSLVIATLMGIVGALIALPVRVPLLADTSAQTVPGIGNLLFEIFPQSLGTIFLHSGEYIVPVLVLSLALGLAMAHDPVAARPASALLDSLSRIFHVINTFITEILGVLLIPITAKALHVVMSSVSSGIYSSFLTILVIESLAFLVLFIPLAIFFLSGKKNPFPILYSSLAPALASFGSGNLRFSTGSLIRHVRENLGTKRRYNSVITPTGLLFGRIGTAFVTATSFVIILSSYSQMGISLSNLLWMAIAIPFATIVMGASPQNGPVVVLTLLCSLFGKGFENGYLVMVPIGYLLSMIAALIDAVWITAANALIARKQIPRDQKPARHFI